MLQSICWAADAERAAVEHVDVDHGGSDVAVAEQFLNRPDIQAVLRPVGGKGMAKA